MNPYGISEDWLNETIPCLKDGNWLYKIVCFCLGRRKKKLSYKEMYMLLYGLNRNKIGNGKAKEEALKRILVIYKSHHNNRLPEGVS